MLSASCASAPPRRTDPALDRADALVLQGCYDCLREAREIYAREAAGPARAQVAVRLFETELLLTLRERELALDAAVPLERARALVPGLPPALEAGRYVALVEAIPPDDVGTPREAMRAFRRTHQEVAGRVRDELAWLETGGLRGPVRQYLALALDCGYDGRRRPPDEPRPAGPRAVPAGAPPLVAWRVGICGLIRRDVLEGVRAAEPRFAETSYFLARLGLATVQEDGGLLAREPLTEAYAHLARSPGVTYLNGSFHQLAGDCDAALRFYTETLGLAARHENARLGRVVCLSSLRRHDDAIREATALIDLKQDNVADGYYWRAWNRHVLGALEPARADIESAKRTQSTSEIHTLAGVIEHDQDDLGPAQIDLQIARQGFRGDSNCVAMWYLGLVHLRRNRWLESGRQFEDAMHCYDASAREAEGQMRAVEGREDLDPGFRARRIARLQEAIQEDRRQLHAAAFNAANHYARGGNLDKARVLVEVAARDPSLAVRVKELREIIKAPAAPTPDGAPAVAE